MKTERKRLQDKNGKISRINEKFFVFVFEYRGDCNEKTICLIFMYCCGLESEMKVHFHIRV